MLETRIKVCGITSPEDATLSLSLGADYLGLIFTDSPRQITPARALDIREANPNAVLIGVFADAPIKKIVDICRTCRLDMVQLHGSESPAYCDSLFAQVALPIIKTLKSSQLAETERLSEYSRTSYFLFDLDKKDPKTRDARDRLWSVAAIMRRQGYRIFLAGSLDAANVRNAIENVGPYCIDVASGVEKTPGVKDSDALVRFVREVKG